MALIHWWPLTQDLRDVVGNSTVSGTYTADANGKIGQCYKNTGSGCQSSVKLVEEWSHWKHSVSMSCWVKINYDECNTYVKSLSYDASKSKTNATGNLIGQVSYGGLGIYWRTNNAILSNGSIVDLTTISFRGFTRGNSTSQYTPTYTVEFDKWYHMTLVADYDKKVLKFYVNGEQVGADASYASIPEMTDERKFAWGRSEIYGGNGPGGSLPMRINDIKLYDHALSDYEIKESARALVIHYPFNDPCLEPTTNIDINKNAMTTQSLSGFANGVGASVTFGNYHDYDCFRIYMKKDSITAWTGVYMNINPLSYGAVVGDTVTRSCWMYVPSGQTKPGHFTESIEGTSSGKTYVQYDFNKCDTWQRISLMGTITDTGTNNYLHYFMAMSSGSVDFEFFIRDFQMEIKDHPTPYTPTSREMNLMNESGHIEIKPTTISNISFLTDSAIGDYCLECTGNTIINTPLTGDITNGASASCWINVPTYPSANAIVFADYNSKLAFGFYGTQNAIISCGGQSAPYISNIKSNWADGWNHVVITRNSSGTFSCYLNGTKLSTTDSNNWTSSSGYSTIGGRYNGIYTTYFTGYVDDFRVYHSCLSDDDIQNLYKSKAAISNQDELFTNEIIEDFDEFQVTEKAVVKTKEINEEQYVELEYIENSGTESIDTGYYWQSEKTKLVADINLITNDDNQSLWGNEEAYNSSGSRYFSGVPHGKNGSFAMYIGSTSSTTGFQLTLGTRTVVSVETTGDGKFTSKCGSTTQTISYSGTVMTKKNAYTTSTASTNVGHIFLFANHNSGYGSSNAPTQTVKKMQVYSFDLYDNGKMVRHFVPCKRVHDSKIGMYDTVEQKFYVSYDGANFIAGPEKEKYFSVFSNGELWGKEFNEI